MPHGEGGTLWEEATARRRREVGPSALAVRQGGLCFEGTFDRGLRAPQGRASLPNGWGRPASAATLQLPFAAALGPGVIYEGDFSQPGGRPGA